MISDTTRKSPYLDANGETIREGDRLRFPERVTSEQGNVIYLIGRDDPWRVRFDTEHPVRLSIWAQHKPTIVRTLTE